MGVSRHFTVNGANGKRMDGAAHASILADGVTPGVLFCPYLNKLEGKVSKQARTINGAYEAFSLKFPEEPLRVTTVVIEFATSPPVSTLKPLLPQH